MNKASACRFQRGTTPEEIARTVPFSPRKPSSNWPDDRTRWAVSISPGLNLPVRIMSLLEPDFDFEANTISDLQSVQLIKAELPSLPSSPGIYRMLDRQGNVLYIGKARDLRRRLAYYTRLDNLPSRIMRMVMQVRRLEIVITTSEVQALPA